MTTQTKIDDDEPPLVLQNCSAMSRHVAMSTAKQKPKRGWGLGWFGGKNNNEIHKSDKNSNDKSNESNAPTEQHEEKIEKKSTVIDSNISLTKLDKSLLPKSASSASSSVKTNNKNSNASKRKHRKRIEKKATAIDPNISLSKLDKSLLPTMTSSSISSSVAQPTTPAKTELHPPSPKSLSPRYSSPGVNSSIVGEKGIRQPSKAETTKISNDNGLANGGISPDELSRQKRREEVRQKTVWYEEYIRDHLAKHGDNLSSLNKEELVALGIFDKQRRLDRRLRLWGRRDSEAEPHLTDDELDQLLVLAQRCNQTQNDEAELEILLVQMENNHVVDMDRLYHLELLSRQRLGEILNEEELDALQIFEEKKQDKEDLDSLREKQKDGIDDIDEARFRELTLLERKRNGNKSMTSDELQEVEIIEMRLEDARLNKKDYTKLLRLKEQGKDLDEDRFNLLSLLEHKQYSAEITELEEEVLEQYFALREEEYLDRIESKFDLEKTKKHDKTISDTEQISEPSLLKDEHKREALIDGEQLLHDNLIYKKEPVDDKGENYGIFSKERGERINQNRPQEPEMVHQQLCEDNLTGGALFEGKKVDNVPKHSEAEDNHETKSATTFDEAGISLSERADLVEVQCLLKKQGLPLSLSFTPYCEADDFDMSIVSFSDETYIKDLLFQKENRESDRKEECLEDAYKLYKRAVKKQRLPESEEMLLTMFAKILQQENKEMREADNQFDQLVEKEVSFYELRKQDAQSETIEKNSMKSGQRESETSTSEESTKQNFSVGSKNSTQDIAKIEVEKKCNLETVANPPIKATEDNKTRKNNPLQSAQEGRGTELFERSISNSTEDDGLSQAEVSKATDDEPQLSKQTTDTQIDPIEQLPRSAESEAGKGATQEEVCSSSVKLEEEKKTGRIIILPPGDRRDSGVTEVDEKDISHFKVLKEGDHLEIYSNKLMIDTIDGQTDICDGLSSRESNITEANTESVDDDAAEKAAGDSLQASDIDIDEFSQNAANVNIRFDFLRFATKGKERMVKEEETVNSENSEAIDPMGGDSRKERVDDHTQSPNTRLVSCDVIVQREDLLNTDATVAGQDIKITEVSTISKSSTRDVQNEKHKNFHEKHDKDTHILQQEGGGTIKSKAEDFPRSVIEGGKIEFDLLYELELVTRLRKGIHLTEKQEYELDLLVLVRRGGTLSAEEFDDLEFLKSEREEITLNAAYLTDLYDRSFSGQLVNDDLIYEVEIFHKEFSGEIMSEDEQIELYLFERRLNGGILSKDHLEELGFLRNERLSHCSNEVEELTISDRSSRRPTDRHFMTKIEPSISGTSSRRLTDHLSVGGKERSIDDEDSIYRRELLNRQMTGQRLDKKEFGWLQILAKKARNEELDENDLDELEIMRNQRNETEVAFVNTKKLLEEELKRQHKNKVKEQRRKEKEQRRKEKQEREKLKKMRKRSKSRVRSDTGSNEKTDVANSRDAKTEVQIIGTPSLQLPRPEDENYEEPKIGVFGGVFQKAKKQRQELKLEEAKRLQAELIREHMKALALEHEAEDLERENVMQEQLVQETIEKKRAASTIGSSYRSSIDSSFWDTSSADNSEESDGSSWTSWDTSSDEDSSQSEELDEIQQNEKESGKKVDNGEADNSVELSKPVSKEVVSRSLAIDRNPIESSPVLNPSNGDSTHNSTDNEKHQFLPNPPDRLRGEASNHSADSGKIGSREERRPRTGDLKGSPSRSTLGLHLKKKKKKRSKHGDDVSLGTLQLSKSSKEGLAFQNNVDKTTKSKSRPWIVNDPIGNSINSNHLHTTKNGDLDNCDENTASESDPYPPFISTISEGDEDEEESISCVHSGTEGGRDVDLEVQDSSLDLEQSQLDSLATSLTQIGEEAYDLGSQEYENIESRLGGKFKNKQAEFDLTWEMTVADENVIVQINQRLRERQRVLEVKKEKKKEKKERKDLKEVPRLFLFEGERIVKKHKKRKNKKNLQKKLNRTLTKEFLKAMKEVYGSDPDSDDGYQVEINEERRTANVDMEDGNDLMTPPFSPQEQIFDDDGSDPLIYSENANQLIEESSNNSDDESVKFDAEYLKRLQARSLPTDLKRMLSGRNMLSIRNLTSGPNKIIKREGLDDYSFTPDIDEGYRKGSRRPRRKKTGEIVNPDIDPAEVYAQELVNQHERKTFTIAGLRKEIEDMKRNGNFAGESNSGFGNFDAISPPALNQSKPKLKNAKTKKDSLGRGIESLERQRPKLTSARSARSLGTTFSDQGLLTGNRRARRRNSPLGLARPPIVEKDIDDDDKGGGILMTRKVSSDSFHEHDRMDQKPGTTGVNSRLPNLKLFGAIKKSLKTKKPTKFENTDGGGLLNGAHDDEFETSESKGGMEADESYRNTPSLRQQDPLPLPGEGDDNKYQRANKMFEKVKIKGVLSKLKLPGKNNGNRKFGGGIMMNDRENFNRINMAGRLL